MVSVGSGIALLHNSLNKPMNISRLFHLMASGLFDTKPLHKPVMTYHELYY